MWSVAEKGIKDVSKVFDQNNWKGGDAINPIGKSVVEFCGGRSGVVLCILALRCLFDLQVVQGLWEKRGRSAERLQGKWYPQGRDRL